jgi:TRAP-type C4-dicarboxylate transport system substrate-binding protein
MRAAVTEAVAFQRTLAVEEHDASRQAIEQAGCQIVSLNTQEHAAFVDAVQPLITEARKTYGEAMFTMVVEVEAGRSRAGL